MANASGGGIPFGNAAAIKEESYALWRFNTIENVWRDLVFALRGLRRSPGFVLSALLSLGLGIAVNTTIFSVGMEFLLSEPSVRDSAAVVQARLGGSSYLRPEALEFLRQTGTFDGVAGELRETSLNWNDGGQPRRIFAI